MIHHEMPGPTCPACRAPARPGARFCVRCGAPVAGPLRYGTLVDTGAVPLSAPPRRTTGPVVLVALGVVLALLVGAVVTVLVVGPSSASALGPGTAPGPAAGAAGAAGAAAGTPPSVPWATGTAPRANALNELQNQRTEDLPSVEDLIGSWVPQLSSKRVGDDAEGRTWDPEAVLAEHRELRTAHPDARLVWSGDFGSFAAGDFWITLLASPSSTAEGANAWCDSAGLAADHCYAKRLATSGGPDGHTVLRDEPAGPTGTGAEPVVGDAGWAPGVTGYGTVRPRELNANGNGSSYIEDVTWDSWGGATATGRGVAGWLPPWGSGPDTRLEPAVVVASDLGDCNGTWGYRRLGWYFPSKGESEADAYPGYDAICTSY